MAWPVGPSAGVGKAGGSVVEFLSNCPGASSGPSVAPGRELRVGLGALVAIHWPVPRLEASLGTSSSTPCPVLFLSCPTTPLPPILGGGPGVWAWPAAGVPHGRPGLGDKVGVSRPRAVASVLRAGAITPVVRDSALPAGLTSSPARTSHSQMGCLVQKHLNKAYQMPPMSKSPPGGPPGGIQTVLVGDYECLVGPMFAVTQLTLAEAVEGPLHLINEDAETLRVGVFLGGLQN